MSFLPLLTIIAGLLAGFTHSVYFNIAALELTVLCLTLQPQLAVFVWVPFLTFILVLDCIHRLLASATSVVSSIYLRLRGCSDNHDSGIRPILSTQSTFICRQASATATPPSTTTPTDGHVPGCTTATKRGSSPLDLQTGDDEYRDEEENRSTQDEHFLLHLRDLVLSDWTLLLVNSKHVLAWTKKQIKGIMFDSDTDENTGLGYPSKPCDANDTEEAQYVEDKPFNLLDLLRQLTNDNGKVNKVEFEISNEDVVSIFNIFHNTVDGGDISSYAAFKSGAVLSISPVSSIASLECTSLKPFVPTDDSFTERSVSSDDERKSTPRSHGTIPVLSDTDAATPSSDPALLSLVDVDVQVCATPKTSSRPEYPADTVGSTSSELESSVCFDAPGFIPREIYDDSSDEIEGQEQVPEIPLHFEAHLNPIETIWESVGDVDDATDVSDDETLVDGEGRAPASPVANDAPRYIPVEIIWEVDGVAFNDIVLVDETLRAGEPAYFITDTPGGSIAREIIWESADDAVDDTSDFSDDETLIDGEGRVPASPVHYDVPGFIPMEIAWASDVDAFDGTFLVDETLEEGEPAYLIIETPGGVIRREIILESVAPRG